MEKIPNCPPHTNNTLHLSAFTLQPLRKEAPAESGPQHQGHQPHNSARSTAITSTNQHIYSAGMFL